MKTAPIILVTVLLLLFASSCDIVTGSGETITWEMDYMDFTGVDIGSSFEATITRADNYSVTITVDKSLTEYLRAEQRGNTLHIGLKPGYTYANAEHRARITMPDLRGLALSGAADVKVSGFSSGNAVDFRLSGASVLDIAGMTAGDAVFELSGTSEVTGKITMNNGKLGLSGASFVELEGTAQEMEFAASGGSKFSLPGFSVNAAAVDLSGASSAYINVISRIEIKLSGASELTYAGDPKVGSIDISSGSTVNRK